MSMCMRMMLIVVGLADSLKRPSACTSVRAPTYPTRRYLQQEWKKRKPDQPMPCITKETFCIVKPTVRCVF